MQKRKFYIALLYFLTGFTATVGAQTKDYYSLKEVLSNRYDKLELTTEKDVEQFVKVADKLSCVSSLKINGNLDITKILGAATKLDELYDLVLKQYSGSLNQQLLDSLRFIESVTVYSGEEQIPQLEMLSVLPSLHSLTVYFDEKIDHYDFIKPFKRLNELTLIGDFLPVHLEAIVNEIKNFPVLNTLGISVDRLTDLPKNLKMARMVSTLNLYDNLSRTAGNGIEDLGVEHFEVLYDKEDDVSKGIVINYFSDNSGLSVFERDRLIAIWQGELYETVAQPAENNQVITDSFASAIPFAPTPVIAFKQNTAFNPPYDIIKPDEERFTINPTIASVIHTKAGLNILIPPNVFVDADGRTPAETVYVGITAISTQPELLFSGAPMRAGNYDNPEYFCSGTMFSIAASTAKNELNLKTGEQIKIEYTGAPDSTTSPYFLDEESKSWFDLKVYYYSDEGLTPHDFYNLKQNTGTNHYYHFDISNFDTRYHSANHYFLNDEGNTNQLLYEKDKYYSDLEKSWMKPDKTALSIRIKKGKNLVKLQKLTPKNARKGYVYFRLFDKYDGKLFPELKPFLKYNFMYEAPAGDKREFTRNYLAQHKYYDVRMHYQTGSDYCTITLKTDDGFKLLKAYITIDTDAKKALKQKQRFSKLYKAYNARLASREQAFNRDLKERFASYRQFVDSREENLIRNNQLQEIKIRELGAFATMLIKHPEGTTELIANYTDENGLPIDVKQVFVLQKNMNTVQTFKVGNITLDLPNTSLVVVSDFSGGLYYLSQDLLKAMNLASNSLVYLKMSKLPSSIKTIEDFVKITKYKN